MPNTKSAVKRLRQNQVRQLHNRIVKSELRTQLKKCRQAVAAGDVERAEAEYRDVAKKLDRAGHQNIIHRNKASRTKSRLQRAIKAAKTRTAG